MMPGPAWMNRYSLQNQLAEPTVGGTSLDERLQGLMRQKDRMLRGQSQSTLAESAPGFYDDMAAINQAIPALGQKIARPDAAIQFAPDRGRVSVMNPAQAASNADRLATGRADALGDLQATRSLDAMNVGNARAEDAEMSAPGFGDVAGAKARYNAGASRRIAALGRQSMGGY